MKGRGDHRSPRVRTPFNRVQSLLFPAASASDLRRAARLALGAGLLAGCYGIIHDQITYTISPEYFTRMKFDQFRAVDFGFPPRIFVAEIGFLATWWVGLIAGWFLARIAMPKFGSPGRRVMGAIAMMLGITLIFGIIGYWIGPTLFENRPGWRDALDSLGVTDVTAFQRVAAIHLAGYAGAFLSGLLAIVKFLRASASSE